MTRLAPDLQPTTVMTLTCPPASAQRALVLFENRTEPAWLRTLTPGFRHCFCVIGAGTRWTIVDPLISRIEILNLSGLTEGHLLAHYHSTGRVVLVGDIAPCLPSGGLLPRPLTCVEIVKRLLHVRAPAVFTPRQLHRTLLSLPSFSAYRPL